MYWGVRLRLHSCQMAGEPRCSLPVCLCGQTWACSSASPSPGACLSPAPRLHGCTMSTPELSPNFSAGSSECGPLACEGRGAHWTNSEGWLAWLPHRLAEPVSGLSLSLGLRAASANSLLICGAGEQNQFSLCSSRPPALNRQIHRRKTNRSLIPCVNLNKEVNQGKLK